MENELRNDVVEVVEGVVEVPEVEVPEVVEEVPAEPAVEYIPDWKDQISNMVADFCETGKFTGQYASYSKNTLDKAKDLAGVMALSRASEVERYDAVLKRIEDSLFDTYTLAQMSNESLMNLYDKVSRQKEQSLEAIRKYDNVHKSDYKKSYLRSELAKRVVQMDLDLEEEQVITNALNKIKEHRDAVQRTEMTNSLPFADDLI